MNDSDLEQIKDDLRVIKDCLLGTFGQKGLARRVESLEDERQGLTAKLNGILWLMPVAISALSMFFLFKK